MSYFEARQVLCFLIADWTIITLRGKLFFFFPDEKKDYDIESIGLDLWAERAGNHRRNYVYVESIFLNRIIIKQGLKESDKD